MINYYYGDLFEHVDELLTGGDCVTHFIIHGCNAQGRMGTGFAKTLRAKYPGAYEEYRKEYSANNNRLQVGSVINYAHSTDLIISNAITQDFYGYDGGKYVSYDAIDTAFAELDSISKVLKTLSGVEEVHFHFPKIGSDLGGGHWDVIESIIDHRVQNATKNLYELR
ncbi:putative Appr-1-p processing enzyme [Erwinia phage pEa_SNUABM_47]|uniref:Putative Appr-1-p processing enzyme n=1 Tax=Erwinia phage pEa_SNUABM_47 TaxID=2768774 RepID=A0A7L8ZMG6_9CAUD|nr:putative Appr-1-p processing enzyme [Erwinia phage pEa_SNUABM_47]